MNHTPGIILTLIVLLHVATDVALPSIMGDKRTDSLLMIVTICMLLGVPLAQFSLIAIWTVFGAGSFAWRLPWAAMMTAGMWCALSLGNWLAWPTFFDVLQAQALVTFVVGGVLLTQVPLWQVRLVVGVRYYPPQASNTVADRQFRLKDLLLAMGVLSVLLGTARWVMPAEPWWQDLWSLSFLVLLAQVLGLNLLIALPVIGISAIASKSWQLMGVLIFIPYSIVATHVQGFVLNDGPMVFELQHVGLINVGQVLALGGTLALLRWQGFRWVTHKAWQEERRMSRATTGEQPSLVTETELPTAQE